jgi:hypothetical protein
VKNAGNQNPCGYLPVKHDVPAVLHAPQAVRISSQARPDAGLSASIWQYASKLSI